MSNLEKLIKNGQELSVENIIQSIRESLDESIRDKVEFKVTRVTPEEMEKEFLRDKTTRKD